MVGHATGRLPVPTSSFRMARERSDPADASTGKVSVPNDFRDPLRARARAIYNPFWYEAKPFLCALLGGGVMLLLEGALAKLSGGLLLIVGAAIFWMRLCARRALEAERAQELLERLGDKG